MKLRSAFASAVQRLRAANVPSPERDAQILLAHVLGWPAWKVLTQSDDVLPIQAQRQFDAALGERAKRRPLAQITGSRLFYGRSFQVTPDVLDPRPETEILIEEIMKKSPQRLLDLGTGSGIIALSVALERPQTEVWATDISMAALKVARTNAAALGVAGVRMIQGDWAHALRGPFDVIASNPPYIAEDEMTELAPEVRQYEPHLALSPGGDGLGAYRVIFAQSGARLAPKGWLMVEMGYQQGPALQVLARHNGYENTSIVQDFDQKNRVFLAQKA